MKEQDYILTIRRQDRIIQELNAKLVELVNGMFTQGQVGCALAFEAGQRIAELERHIETYGVDNAFA